MSHYEWAKKLKNPKTKADVDAGIVGLCMHIVSSRAYNPETAQQALGPGPMPYPKEGGKVYGTWRVQVPHAQFDKHHWHLYQMLHKMPSTQESRRAIDKTIAHLCERTEAYCAMSFGAGKRKTEGGGEPPAKHKRMELDPRFMVELPFDILERLLLFGFTWLDVVAVYEVMALAKNKDTADAMLASIDTHKKLRIALTRETMARETLANVLNAHPSFRDIAMRKYANAFYKYFSVRSGTNSKHWRPLDIDQGLLCREDPLSHYALHVAAYVPLLSRYGTINPHDGMDHVAIIAYAAKWRRKLEFLYEDTGFVYDERVFDGTNNDSPYGPQLEPKLNGDTYAVFLAMLNAPTRVPGAQVVEYMRENTITKIPVKEIKYLTMSAPFDYTENNGYLFSTMMSSINEYVQKAELLDWRSRVNTVPSALEVLMFTERYDIPPLLLPRAHGTVIEKMNQVYDGENRLPRPSLRASIHIDKVQEFRINLALAYKHLPSYSVFRHQVDVIDPGPFHVFDVDGYRRAIKSKPRQWTDMIKCDTMVPPKSGDYDFWAYFGLDRRIKKLREYSRNNIYSQLLVALQYYTDSNTLLMKLPQNEQTALDAMASSYSEFLFVALRCIPESELGELKDDMAIFRDLWEFFVWQDSPNPLPAGKSKHANALLGTVATVSTDDLKQTIDHINGDYPVRLFATQTLRYMVAHIGIDHFTTLFNENLFDNVKNLPEPDTWNDLFEMFTNPAHVQSNANETLSRLREHKIYVKELLEDIQDEEDYSRLSLQGLTPEKAISETNAAFADMLSNLYGWNLDYITE